MNVNTIIYILVAIAIISGIYLVLTSSPQSAQAPTEATNQSEEVAENTETLPEATDATTEPSDIAEAEPGDTPAPGGNDIGMEFPDPDSDAVIDTEVDTVTDGDATDEADDLTSETEPQTREFTLDAFNFGYSTEEIRVNEGDTVTITLTNSDGFHDWVVDEFDAATEKISEGDTTSVTFVADQAGTYEYYCSVGSHRAQGMVGTLIVE